MSASVPSTPRCAVNSAPAAAAEPNEGNALLRRRLMRPPSRRAYRAGSTERQSRPQPCRHAFSSIAYAARDNCPQTSRRCHKPRTKTALRDPVFACHAAVSAAQQPQRAADEGTPPASAEQACPQRQEPRFSAENSAGRRSVASVRHTTSRAGSQREMRARSRRASNQR